ncbi:MAG: hypothetical protein JSV89_18240 [Spirochaetaceae bacterium]|nr:MAG: hypothetical protein JSV89_18240 [Spirochaetaceae bacterium]
MISRQDFTFTIGYEGNVAVVDGALKKRYGSLSAEQLAEKQLYKQAICSAVYEASSGQGSGEALARVLEIYNSKAAKRIGSVEELKRTFGVLEVPEGIAKVTVI